MSLIGDRLSIPFRAAGEFASGSEFEEFVRTASGYQGLKHTSVHLCRRDKLLKLTCEIRLHEI